MRRFLALYPLRWTQPQSWDWVDRLTVAVIAAWTATGLVAGVAASRALVLGLWPGVALCAGMLALGVIASHWIMAYVVYRIDLLSARSGQGAPPLTIWDRRLGIGLLSYFLLLIPVVLLNSLVMNAAPPFWRSWDGEVIDVGNVFFIVGLITLIVRDIGSHPGALRTWTARALCGVLGIWLISELYYRLSLLFPKVLPSLGAFVPAYGPLSGAYISLAALAVLAAAIFDRMLGNTPSGRPT